MSFRASLGCHLGVLWDFMQGFLSGCLNNHVGFLKASLRLHLGFLQSFFRVSVRVSLGFQFRFLQGFRDSLGCDLRIHKRLLYGFIYSFSLFHLGFLQGFFKCSFRVSLGFHFWFLQGFILVSFRVFEGLIQGFFRIYL